MTDTIQQQVRTIATQARAAAQQLATLSAEQKNQALSNIAAEIRRQKTAILDGNKTDISAAEQHQLSTALLDRLRLDADRIEAMAAGVEAIMTLPDPVGQILASWERPNGLKISRVSVPLGVIGVIFESRPNVTVDAAALCLKAGNAVILRGGSDSFASASAIMQCITAGLSAADLPEAAVQMIPTQDRAAVGEMLKCDDCIDVIIPRGGRSLIERVQAESKIPLLKHLDGLCHTYIHASADAEMAASIIFNAKLRRPGICGATETVLIDKNIVQTHLPNVLQKLLEHDCEVRGDETVQALNPQVQLANEADWDTEYLDRIVSIKTVNNIDEAIAHIQQHGSQHTDAIIAEDADAVSQFFQRVDSAIVMHNTSTQFADGGEFGMGAEIGIATGKLHARGPVGVQQLTTFKYQVDGTGQIRA